MAADAPDAPETMTAHVALKMPGGTLQAELTVPTGPVSLVQLLPMAGALADAITDAAVDAVKETGRRVSCCKGCGACCRQLVPVSEVEARRIRDLIESLPEPRRSAIRARFAEARRTLDAAGLLEALQHPDRWEDEPRAVGLEYFHQGIACPFLEEESCSIHPDRPIACREYLVTSPTADCARPSPETVHMVPMPTSVWRALARVGVPDSSAKAPRWVPLILAPEWADAHPDESPLRPGPELLRELIGHVARAEVPPLPPRGRNS